MDDLINRAQGLVCAYDAFMSYNSKDSEGQTRLKSALPVPNTRKGIMHTLEQEKYLVPGEVEDIVIPIDAPMGLRAVVSFGVHWLISDEPLYRLAETGFLAIGQRGTPG
jgi:hypothetical protein